MTTRVAIPRRPPRQALWLREDAVRSASPLDVDREAGIIHGVKVLGTKSSNGRRYTATAIQQAAQLYEGVMVNVDHPKQKPTQSRSAYDRLGKLQNVRVEPDGLYADLHLLTSHPLARRLMEAAEKMPDAFGLSHNAQGNGRTEEGVFVVEEITEVRHVDLVADPATTQSLCESRSPRMAAKKKPAKKPKANLIEMYEDDALLDQPGGAAPVADAGDHTDDLFNAFKKLKETDPEKANKILAMLKAEMSAAGDDEAVEEEDDQEELDDEMEEACDEDEEVEESRRRKPGKGVSLQEEVQRLRLEKRCRRLCAEVGVTATEELVEALADMGGEAKAKKHLAWIKANLVAGRKGQKPRSQSPGQSLTESHDDDRPVHQRIPKDMTEQLNWLRN